MVDIQKLAAATQAALGNFAKVEIVTIKPDGTVANNNNSAQGINIGALLTKKDTDELPKTFTSYGTPSPLMQPAEPKKEDVPVISLQKLIDYFNSRAKEADRAE